jgi:hypothetical protein
MRSYRFPLPHGYTLLFTVRRYRFRLLHGYNSLLGLLTYARSSLANVDRSNLRPEAAS